MENSIKMDDLGIPLFLETPIWAFTGAYGEATFPSCIYKLVGYQLDDNFIYSYRSGAHLVASMGLVYLPAFAMNINQLQMNISKYFKSTWVGKSLKIFVSPWGSCKIQNQKKHKTELQNIFQ